MSDTLPEPKYRNRPAMLLAGTLKTCAHAEARQQIPLQWGDFFALDVPEIHAASVYYGVVTRADEETMDHMVAIEVSSFDGVNAPHTATVPAARYAVFTVDGIANIQQNWMDICGEWLPTSGYHAAETPAFERYDERYDSETQTGPVEIWFPIIEPVR